MNTSDAAHGKWEFIFKEYGLPPHTGNKHYNGPCPLCGKKKKFRIDDKHGTGGWICVCGHGNGLDLIMAKTGREYTEVCREIDVMIGNDGNKDIAVTMEDDGHIMAMEHYNSLYPVKGSPVERYLASRGITLLPQHSVRFSQREYSTSVKSDLPAMYCVASNYKNRIKYKHCTFILEDKKANIEAPKQMGTIKEYSGAVAVKLFGYGTILGIAEGIETALSTTQMYRIPTWSTMNSAFMKRFLAPEGVEVLYIFADNDKNGTGLAAAFECGRSNILKANSIKEVVIVWPLKDESDFNDILLDEKPKVMKWKLKK